jgi:hypothetical protein
MAKKKRHWLWNILLVLTLIVCILAFIAHYKNWTKIEKDHLRILSGVYYKELKFTEIDSVKWVEKIPQMERFHGFSAWTTEKGVFKDSLIENKKVYVFIDNLKNQKIKFVYHDSLHLYINYSDSLETLELYKTINFKLDSIRSQLNVKN